MNWKLKYLGQSIFLGIYWFSVEVASSILNKLTETQDWIILATAFIFSAIFITANILTEIYSTITNRKEENKND